MLVRHIMPVICCSRLSAISVTNSSAPTQTLIVGSFGCALLGSRSSREGSAAGALVGAPERPGPPKEFALLQPLNPASAASTRSTQPGFTESFMPGNCAKSKFHDPLLSIHDPRDEIKQQHVKDRP